MSYILPPLMEIPLDAWGEITSHTGWPAMLHLGSTSREGRIRWKKIIESSLFIQSFKSYQLFCLVQTKRYEWKEESNIDPRTHQVKVLNRAGEAYSGPFLAEIEMPFHQSWLFRQINQRYVQSNSPLINLKDPIENTTYVWQPYATTFAKTNTTGAVQPAWKKVSLGKMIRGLDFFGDRLLVAATSQSLVFLDRKTAEVITEYPLFSRIGALKADYQKGEMVIAESDKHVTLSFTPTIEPQRSLVPLSTTQKARTNKILFIIKDIFRNYFSWSGLTLIGNTFAFTARRLKWPVFLYFYLKVMSYPEIREKLTKAIIDIMAVGITPVLLTAVWVAILAVTIALIGTAILLTSRSCLEAHYY